MRAYEIEVEQEAIRLIRDRGLAPWRAMAEAAENVRRRRERGRRVR